MPGTAKPMPKVNPCNDSQGYVYGIKLRFGIRELCQTLLRRKISKMTSTKVNVAFISGHTDLSHDDFDRIYVPLIDAALSEGHSLILGDAVGADWRALKYLMSKEQSHILYTHHASTIFANSAALV